MFPIELGIDCAIWTNGPLTLAGLEQLRLMIDLACKHRRKHRKTPRKKRGAP